MPAHRVENGNFIKLRNQSLVKQVKRLAKESQTDPATWVSEIVDDFIRAHRSGRFIPPVDRHTERHDDFDRGEYHIDVYGEKEEES
jgi:hypothetical protein